MVRRDRRRALYLAGVLDRRFRAEHPRARRLRRRVRPPAAAPAHGHRHGGCAFRRRPPPVGASPKLPTRGVPLARGDPRAAIAARLFVRPPFANPRPTPPAAPPPLP